jgi:hypothetical protein
MTPFIFSHILGFVTPTPTQLVCALSQLHPWTSGGTDKTHNQKDIGLNPQVTKSKECYLFLSIKEYE